MINKRLNEKELTCHGTEKTTAPSSPIGRSRQSHYRQVVAPSILCGASLLTQCIAGQTSFLSLRALGFPFFLPQWSRCCFLVCRCCLFCACVLLCTCVSLLIRFLVVPSGLSFCLFVVCLLCSFSAPCCSLFVLFVDFPSSLPPPFPCCLCARPHVLNPFFFPHGKQGGSNPRMVQRLIKLFL